MTDFELAPGIDGLFAAYDLTEARLEERVALSDIAMSDKDSPYEFELLAAAYQERTARTQFNRARIALFGTLQVSFFQERGIEVTHEMLRPEIVLHEDFDKRLIILDREAHEKRNKVIGERFSNSIAAPVSVPLLGLENGIHATWAKVNRPTMEASSLALLNVFMNNPDHQFTTKELLELDIVKTPSLIRETLGSLHERWGLIEKKADPDDGRHARLYQIAQSIIFELPELEEIEETVADNPEGAKTEQLVITDEFAEGLTILDPEANKKRTAGVKEAFHEAEVVTVSITGDSIIVDGRVYKVKMPEYLLVYNVLFNNPDCQISPSDVVDSPLLDQISPYTARYDKASVFGRAIKSLNHPFRLTGKLISLRMGAARSTRHQLAPYVVIEPLLGKDPEMLEPSEIATGAAEAKVPENQEQPSQGPLVPEKSAEEQRIVELQAAAIRSIETRQSFPIPQNINDLEHVVRAVLAHKAKIPAGSYQMVRYNEFTKALMMQAKHLESQKQ